jgi:hypothetical protein
MMSVRLLPTSQPKIFIFWILLFLLGASYSVFALDQAQIRLLAAEDGIVENITAAAFFIAALLSGWSARKTRNPWFALLCFFFFACGGEEISWGQRILGFDTPLALKAENMQGETNVHNLVWFHGTDRIGARNLFNMDRLFFLFTMAYGVIIPLAFTSSAQIRSWLNRIRLPIPARAIGLLFLVAYAISKMLTAFMPALEHQVVEVKECAFALVFAALACEFLTRDLQASGVRVARDERTRAGALRASV